MGTRGFVGVGTPDKWRGVYNHADSSPTYLGHELWADVIDAYRAKKMPELEARLFEAGRVEAFLKGKIAKADDREIADSADPIAIEWIYLIDGSQLHVLGNEQLGDGQFAHFVVESCSLEGREPDWYAIERKRERHNAPMTLAFIKKRFGEQAYRQAKAEMLGDDDE